MNVADRVEQLIEGVVEAEGFELVHVAFQPKGAASILRIYIDKPGGVNLSDCQRVSRQVGVVLDVEDLIPHQYVLEVSSPGLERPIFKESEYQRFKGKEVRVTLLEKLEGRRNFTGFIRDFANRTLRLESQGREYEIPVDRIKKANLVYRFQ